MTYMQIAQYNVPGAGAGPRHRVEMARRGRIVPVLEADRRRVDVEDLGIGL